MCVCECVSVCNGEGGVSGSFCCFFKHDIHSFIYSNFSLTHVLPLTHPGCSTEIQKVGLEPKHILVALNTHTGGQTEERGRKGGMHMVACVCMLGQQGWCLSWHVRGRRLLLGHLHCHLVSGQDVLEKEERTKNN